MKSLKFNPLTKTPVGRRAMSIRASGKRSGKPLGTGAVQDNPDMDALPGFGKEDNTIARNRGRPEDRTGAKDVFNKKGTFDKVGVKDASGRESKGKGVYAYTVKYGGNIDSYSPIYIPESFGDDAITAMELPNYLFLLAIVAGGSFAFPLAIVFLAGDNTVPTGVFP